METVTINLTDYSRKKSGFKKPKNADNVQKQIFAYIILAGILVVFAACFGGRMFTEKMNTNLDKKLTALKKDTEILKQEEEKLSQFKDNLKKEKEAAEYKILTLNKINNFFLPWSEVLKEISAKIPKDIIVLKIEKTNSSGKTVQDLSTPKLKISGIISAKGQSHKPLSLISLFIFNLNENKESVLSNAKISKLDFDDKTKSYEFEIETSVNRNLPKLADAEQKTATTEKAKKL